MQMILYEKTEGLCFPEWHFPYNPNTILLIRMSFAKRPRIIHGESQIMSIDFELPK